jgi:hypothetical protein
VLRRPIEPARITGHLPGGNAHDETILELETNVRQIEEEKSRLKQKRAGILNYRILLYGYGKSVFEPIVRSALRELGFGVPEPDLFGNC